MSESEWSERNESRGGNEFRHNNDNRGGGDFRGGNERVHDAPIASEKVIIDRKVFFLDLKENARGRFMKITEDVNGRRDTIMLPAPAFEDFAAALNRLVEYESTLS